MIFNNCGFIPCLLKMKIRNHLFFAAVLWATSLTAGYAQKKTEAQAREKRIGIARIQIFASPAKGTPIAEVAKMPLFFGASSDEYRYKKRTILEQQPPTTGDTIRDITSDSLAVYLKRDLYTMSGYDDKGGNSRDKRNAIHDLPTENPQKMAVDTIFDEAIDIACYWVFAQAPDNKARYIPSILLKMEVYDRSGQAQPEKAITLPASEIKTKHFKEAYGVSYDFTKGITVDEIADGGIAGNVVVDVYLQALNKLLAKNK